MLKPYTIVGVLENNIRRNLTEATQPELTLSYQQIPRDSLFYSFVLASATQFILHTGGDVDLTQSIHRVMRETAPGFAVDDLKSMESALEDATGNQRLGVYLIGSFAALAALMVMAGLYGVLSQLVNQRQQEVGIRIALGATRESILALFLRQSWTLIAFGIAAGLVASVLATRTGPELPLQCADAGSPVLLGGRDRPGARRHSRRPDSGAKGIAGRADGGVAERVVLFLLAIIMNSD